MKLNQLTSKIRNTLEQSKFGAQKLALVYTVEQEATHKLTKTRIALIVSLMNDALENLEEIEKAEGIIHHE